MEINYIHKNYSYPLWVKKNTAIYVFLYLTTLAITGCATSMAPGQFMKEFPSSTKSIFYSRVDANQALASGECKVLVSNRSYEAPIGLTVGHDLSNGAKGVDEWVQTDGGNAFSLNNYRWIDLIDKTQLIVYFDTMICNKSNSSQIGI